MTVTYDESFEKNLSWVKKVIDSCETISHIETSINLVNNFTTFYLKNKELDLYRRAERILRKKLTEKQFNLCKH
jgi:hypothetical protein